MNNKLLCRTDFETCLLPSARCSKGNCQVFGPRRAECCVGDRAVSSWWVQVGKYPREENQPLTGLGQTLATPCAEFRPLQGGWHKTNDMQNIAIIPLHHFMH